MMKGRVGECLFLVALSLWPSAAHADDTDLDGLTIVSVRFVRHNIFDSADPKTSAWLHRGANALHMVSREDFLRSMLLFKVGDRYTASVAAESARVLRALGVVNPVEITARRVDGGVEVTVETHDRWSLEIGGEFGVFGSRRDYGIELEEANLLGRGKSVGVEYEADDERRSWSVRYLDPNLVGSRWRLASERADLSDGSREGIRIERPFYALGTRWSGGIESSSETITDHLYSESESVVAGDRDSRFRRVWGGARLGGSGDVARRIVGGWVERRDRYSEWSHEPDGTAYPTPEDLEVEGPTVAYERIADRFGVVRGFRTWTVQEDVALGPNFSLSATLSLPGFGGDRRRFLLDGWGRAAKRRGRWLLLGDVWLSGRVEDSETRNLLAGVQLGAAQLGRRGWQLRLVTEASHELDRGVQLTLGADVGLRGWDPDYFDGTGRALINAQWRVLLREEVLGLFSFGALLFCDAGTTWDPRVGPDTGGVRLDAGVGLLFDLAHLSRTNLLRIDVALPDDGSGPKITASTSSIFRRPSRRR